MNNKTLISLIVGLCSATLLSTAAITMNTTTTKDSDRHILVDKWATYYNAASKDRPLKEIEALQSIREQALAEHLNWDWWDASDKYVQTSIRRDWKQRDSLYQSLAEQVRAYNEPIVSYVFGQSRGGESRFDTSRVTAERDRLSSGHNTAFYYNDYRVSGLMGGMLPECLQSDYEYVLWSMYPASVDLLKEALGGRYPAGALLQYLQAGDSTVALKALATKYSGSAIGYYAEDRLIALRKSELDRSETASSQQYRELERDCRQLLNRKNQFTGQEKQIASGVSSTESIMDELKSKGLWITVQGDSATVVLRNLSSAVLTIKNRESGYEHREDISNPVMSFYVRDSVRIALPVLDDGDYEALVSNGKTRESTYFSSHTLSIALRDSDIGYGVYVTNYQSGEPLNNCTLTLKKGGREVASEPDFKLSQGFTPLPVSLASQIKGNATYELIALCPREYGRAMRSSKPVSIYNGYESRDERGWEQKRVGIYIDRGAYNPGDTVYFKAVLYKGDLIDEVSCENEGTQVTVSLYDSEDNELSQKTLLTNDFGSIAGEFSIPPTGLRNGHFHISVSGSGYDESSYFRVDEYVLPTFDCQFEDGDTLYLPGDTVTVRGRVQAYSGHSLSSATISYRVTTGRDVYAQGTLTPTDNGAFEINFLSDKDRKWGYYQVSVIITDTTGETHEYHHAMSVTSVINLQIQMDGADASIRQQDGQMAELMQGDSLSFTLTVTDGNSDRVPLEVSYEVLNAKDLVLFEGTASSGETISRDMSELPSGLYKIVAQCEQPYDGAEDGVIKKREQRQVLKLGATDTSLDAPIDYLFVPGPEVMESGESIEVRFGTTTAPVWAIAELYGDGRKVLRSEVIHLGGQSSLTTVDFPYESSYPDAVRLRIFYFRDGEAQDYGREFRRSVHTLDLPLQWSRFEDRTMPSTHYSLSLKTIPGVEAVAAIYDRSVDLMGQSIWQGVSLRQFSVPYVGINSECGSVSSGRGWAAYRYRMSKSAAGGVNTMMVMEEASMAMPLMDAAPMSAESTDSESKLTTIRDNFKSTLTFEPMLRSDEQGNITLDFETSDQLSTYVVKVFAHTRGMQNSYLEREMLVSTPVKVSLVEPQYLYLGDKWRLQASISSNVERDLDGTLSLEQYDGEDYKSLSPIYKASERVHLPAGGSVAVTFDTEALQHIGTQGIKLVFVADGPEPYSDGLFVSVPVYEREQTITESHSAVLLPGMDREALVSSLRSAFVNVPGVDAKERVIPVIDMVLKALPSRSDPTTTNVIDLSEALYVRTVARSLGQSIDESSYSDEKLLERILACHNADGGFGWFEGMSSSPVLTAVLLERFYKLQKVGYDSSRVKLDAAVQFLDRSQFRGDYPGWCGGITMAQYLYVRSLYPEVKWVTIEPGLDKAGFKKQMTEFRKYCKNYLTPSSDRGLNGQILSKARRLSTLEHLLSSAEGVSLAGAWGVKLNSSSKMKKSLQDDVESLKQYAVQHRDGGIYYPNAVMPFRGLLESEAYAHSMLCDLMQSYAPDISDGIRLWLMLQKETQHWDSTPDFVDAIASVMAGSDALKSTQVVELSATFTKPYESIQASGNGFRIERKFYLTRTSSEGKVEYYEIQPGAELQVGDKVRIDYLIWNAENRSYVRLLAPREASLRPVDQLSGMYGWGVMPLRVSRWWSFQPMGYRNVKASRSEYYFDSYPEESTTISEEMFVTQAGTFSAPVLTIESLYAPHYRANSDYNGYITVE